MYSVMQTGQGGSGMQTFNQSLADLYIHGKVDLETAMARSSMPEELQELINRNVTLGGRQMNAQPPGMPGGPPRGPVVARKP
jgi:Tfp pilus assembly ATPase PilU